MPALLHRHQDPHCWCGGVFHKKKFVLNVYAFLCWLCRIVIFSPLLIPVLSYLKHAGCGFVGFTQRYMAVAAINGLNGSYVMKVHLHVWLFLFVPSPLCWWLNLLIIIFSGVWQTISCSFCWSEEAKERRIQVVLSLLSLGFSPWNSDCFCNL